jgi:hypothetical protein
MRIGYEEVGGVQTWINGTHTELQLEHPSQQDVAVHLQPATRHLFKNRKASDTC